jgi:hypothetical protein
MKMEKLRKKLLTFHKPYGIINHVAERYMNRTAESGEAIFSSLLKESQKLLTKREK